MSTAYKEALALRNRLTEGWKSTAHAQDWIENVASREMAMSVPAHLMPRLSTEILPESPAYYVSDEPMDVLAVAAQKFQPEPLLAADLMTPSGFMLLSRPLFAYGGLGEDASKITYAPTDWPPTRGPLAIGWWPVRHWLNPETEWSVSPSAERHLDGILIYGYLRSDSGEWILASVYTVPFEAEFWITNMATSVRSIMLPFQALMRLISERVFAAESKATGGKKSKRASKSQPVLVVSLPRKDASGHKPPAGKTVEWTKRWWVNPHWRNQWYPSLGAHRQKWIKGYVKGPDDQPFETAADRAFRA